MHTPRTSSLHPSLLINKTLPVLPSQPTLPGPPHYSPFSNLSSLDNFISPTDAEKERISLYDGEDKLPQVVPAAMRNIKTAANRTIQILSPIPLDCLTIVPQEYSVTQLLAVLHFAELPDEVTRPSHS